MCGIIAILNTDACSNSSTVNLHASLQMIHHRGPDDKGSWTDEHGRVILGHNRLSIIDLTNGQQPISNETEDIQLIVNGEFYGFEKIRDELQAAGHVFKTQSDSEIAIHLYEDQGLSFVDSLRGEFALCLWDARKSLLVCVRDRFGVKPLFYANIDGRLVVGSEVKAFLPLGLKPEWDIDSVINSGIFFDSRTMFKGVSKLLPGHYMIATLSGSIEVRKYWEADYADKNVIETRSVEEMIAGVRSRLIEAVRVRLRADVPVAVYLSGGIDSSTVLGIATSILREENPNAKIDTFTISFTDARQLDEGDIAERMAAYCGANFKKLCLREMDLSAAFDDAVWHCEAPISNLNSVAKFLLSRFVHEEGFKVVLTGEGADSHFAGYAFVVTDFLREDDISFNTVVDQRLAKLETLESASSMRIDKVSPMSYSDEIVSRRMLNGISTHRILSSLFGLPKEMFTDAVLNRTGGPDPCFTMAASVDGVARFRAKNKWHPLHTALYIESHTIIPNFLCNHLGDRTEMAHSIEGRVPFLDHLLTEYVNQLPPSVKIKYPTEKWILREAAKPYINHELYCRTKQHFIAPPAENKDTPHGIYLNKRLVREAVEALGWIRWDFVEKMKAAFIENQSCDAHNILNVILSMVIISEKFGVKPYGKE
jgi:asparagine synthase (glutamine-hydrolysing)